MSRINLIHFQVNEWFKWERLNDQWASIAHYANEPGLSYANSMPVRRSFQLGSSVYNNNNQSNNSNNLIDK